MASYKQCFVPTCKNDSINSPDKIFVRIREDLRKKWCHQVNATYYSVCNIYCCEDHFDPSQDLKNHQQCKLMGDEPQLKPNAVLRYLTGTSKDLSQLSLQLALPVSKAKKRKYCEDLNMPSTSTYSTLPVKVQDAVTQCKLTMVDKSTNYKVRKYKSNVGSVELPSSQDTSSAPTPSSFGCTSETEESTVGEQNKQSRQIMLDLVLKKPKMYLGLPKQYLWLIDFIIKKSTSQIESLYIIITLLKIKQNDSVERISDQFNVSRTKLSSMILKSIEVLANFFQNFVYCPEPRQIKHNLPLVFKVRFANVEMIIDCFEIQISKPSNPIKQAKTWSQYKNCNTVKYLIGCTPNGFVSFISKGYGGRTSDKAMVQNSGLLDVLKPTSVLLADRGFKEITSLLNTRGIQLLRPPSVYAGTKQTTTETLQSKVIASLRVHVERVIRRVREFSILKPHSVVNYRYVSYLDEIVVIACGLVNLQGEIIKSE